MARTGTVAIPGRSPLRTPNHIAVSSRGAIPHLTPDMLQENSNIRSVYAAFEDYVETFQAKDSAIYNVPSTETLSPLRAFTGLSEQSLLILGPRRIPALPCPGASTATSIAMVTSLGFGMLELQDYTDAIVKLRPDFAVAMGDVLYGHMAGVKRTERMGHRTEEWLRSQLQALQDHKDTASNVKILAPILPVSAFKQAEYLSTLTEDFSCHITGLVVYDSSSISEIPAALHHLLKVSMAPILSPHEFLDDIDRGVDLFATSLVNQATDAGLALDFDFGIGFPTDMEADKRGQLPLALDLWANEYTIDLGTLRHNCECYTCTSGHHRAYLHHLLDAREMLGWVLLQIHNHHIIEKFFSAIRKTIENGTFRDFKATFHNMFSKDLPNKTGVGPRLRGYQYRSDSKNPPKKNPKPYHGFNEYQKVSLKSTEGTKEVVVDIDIENLDIPGIFNDP